MIKLKIGDIVRVKGEELEVYVIKFHYAANGVSGELLLIDPLLAMQYREAELAQKKQVAFHISGKTEALAEAATKALTDESNTFGESL